MASRSSLVVPLLLSVAVHALVVGVGEMVSRRNGGDGKKPFQVEYSATEKTRAEPVPEKGATDEEPGARSLDAISLETPDPKYRPYFQEIRKRIGEHWKEPKLGSSDPDQGTLDLDFTLDRKGNLLEVTVVRSSGVKGLDFAAVTAVKGAAPLPPFPPELGDRKKLVIRALFVYD